MSTCPRAHTGSASHLHLYNIAMWHVQKMATVITMRVQTSWESLLHMMAFAQAISVHGQIVCLTDTLPLHNQTCRATRVSMAKRLPGVTGAAVLLLSSTRRTATLAGVSGPPAVTSPIAKIALVNGRITRPVVRRKNTRKSPRLLRWPRSRLWRTAKRIMDSATYTAPAHSAWDSPAATATEKRSFYVEVG